MTIAPSSAALTASTRGFDGGDRGVGPGCGCCAGRFNPPASRKMTIAIAIMDVTIHIARQRLVLRLASIEVPRAHRTLPPAAGSYTPAAYRRILPLPGQARNRPHTRRFRILL